MILVDGYRDGMLSRTTTILGGGGCKDLRTMVRRAPVKVRARGRGQVCGRRLNNNATFRQAEMRRKKEQFYDT